MLRRFCTLLLVFAALVRPSLLSAQAGHPLTGTVLDAKLEGISFGQDVLINGSRKHTIYVANDNDFLSSFDGKDNSNQFFVFAFDDHDLPFYEPQEFSSERDDDHDGFDHGDHQDRGQDK